MVPVLNFLLLIISVLLLFYFKLQKVVWGAEKKIRQLSHLRDFLLTQLSSLCFLTKSSLKFSILLFVFLLSEIVTVHLFLYMWQFQELITTNKRFREIWFEKEMNISKIY